MTDGDRRTRAGMRAGEALRDGSLSEFLVARARASSDTRLALDVALGLTLVVAFSLWRVPAWYLLAAFGACFLCYGTWAIANRELAETLDAARRRRLALQVLAKIAAACGIAAGIFLMLAVLAKLIGPVIS